MSRLTLIRTVSVLVAVVVLAGGTLNVVGLFFVRRLDQSRTFTAPVRQIVVGVDSGDIEIHAAPAGTPASVRARTASAFRTAGHSEALSDGVLTLSGSCGHGGIGLAFGSCSVDFDVVVPLGTVVRTTTSSGDIRIVGIAGGVQATNSNGDIELSQVGGPVRVRSNNGDVQADRLTAGSVTAVTDNGDVTLKFTAAPSDVTATTDNGDVEVRLPDVGTGYRVQADTDNGDREVGVPEQSNSGRVIRANSSNGDVQVATAR